jgi:Ca2+-binding RTX toxin-like protein
MRKTVLLIVSMATAVFLAGGAALALPSEVPDETPMLNGPVRTIEKVGDNLWVGGNFTQVKNRDGTVVANVSNVAVFDLGTDRYVDIAPKLGAGSTTAKVTEIRAHGDDVLIGGRFAGPTAAQKNLVVVDGATGVAGTQQPRWFNSPVLEALLVAPDLGRVYGGGQSLAAFDFQSGKALWTKAKTTVDPLIHSHNLQAGYRDLERDGSTIWAACACDTVAAPDGTPNPAKALVRLDTEGNHDPSWVSEAGTGGFGISLTQDGGSLYLGAGGNDFLAAYLKTGSGLRNWNRDTSGSAQVVEIVDGQLVAGGHFVEIADEPGDGCGARTSDPAALDPNGECQRRDGLAAYSKFDRASCPNGDRGWRDSDPANDCPVLDPWDPPLTGKYNLAWALYPEATPQGTRLHVGGEFTRVSGITQAHYARLSDAQAPTTCTITGTASAETLTGSPGDDVICGGGGNDTLRGLEGNDTLKGEGGADRLSGGVGDDALDGGDGTSTDTADFSGSPAPVVASLVEGTAAGEGSDTLAGVENLTGSGGDDTLAGSEASNALNGGIGADTIVGMGGADAIKGAAGNDALDSRDGVNGNDTVEGGADTDTCATDATEVSILKCER